MGVPVVLWITRLIAAEHSHRRLCKVSLGRGMAAICEMKCGGRNEGQQDYQGEPAWARVGTHAQFDGEYPPSVQSCLLNAEERKHFGRPSPLILIKPT